MANVNWRASRRDIPRPFLIDILVGHVRERGRAVTAAAPARLLPTAVPTNDEDTKAILHGSQCNANPELRVFDIDDGLTIAGGQGLLKRERTPVYGTIIEVTLKSNIYICG